MNLISVRCQHCGAPLQIGEEARFVTCQFCKTELQVERTDSAVFTQKIDAIHAHTTQMSGELEVIRLQNDLERLDREWQMERERHLVAGRDGARHEPSAYASGVGAIVAVVGGLVFLGFALKTNVPAPVPIFIGIFIVVGFVTAMAGVNKASTLADARTRYERQRQQLVQRLSTAQSQQ